MDKVFDKVWSNCLEIIKDIVEWQHFQTWFEPIKPVALKEKVLTIQVPSQFFYEYLEEHYVSLLAKTLKRELGKDGRLEYRIMVDSGNSKNKPVTMDVSGQGFKTFSNNEMDFPLVINNPVKNLMKNGLPESTWQSLRFTVVANTFINTSSSFGVGISSSLIVRSPGNPYFERTAAFILLPDFKNEHNT
jgi:chromosomal replication initiation ATPase DnaA